MKRRYVAILLVLLAVLAALVAVGWPASTPLVRSVVLGAHYLGQPVVDEQTGRVFVTTENGVVMLDAATGRVRRTIALPGAGQPVVDARLHRVYVPTLAGVAALDAASGRLLWNTTLTPVPTMLVVDDRDGRLYADWSGGVACDSSGCTQEDGDLFTLDARSGRLLRDLTLPRQGELELLFEARARRVVALGGAPYHGPASIALFDAASGRLLHRSALAARQSGRCLPLGQLSLVDEAHERLLIRCLRTSLGLRTAPQAAPPMPITMMEMVDPLTGRLLFTLPTHSAVTAVALDTRAGHFFIADAGPLRLLTIPATSIGGGSFSMRAWTPTGAGRVQMRDERDRRVLWSANVARAPGSIVVDPAHGRVYVASAGPLSTPIEDYAGPGRLTVLDERNGRVLATTALGIGPQSMALDAPARRLIVANEGDLAPRQATDPWGWLPRWLRARLPFLPTSPHPTRRPASVTVLDTSRL